MSTTSTIGSASRNYSTITAWLAAFTTGGWIGNCYNDTEFNATNGETFPLTFNQATSAANFITLTTGAGQSFFDKGSSINHLRYDQANGVGITVSGYAKDCIVVTCDYASFSKLQIQTTATARTPMTDNGNTPHNHHDYMLSEYAGSTGAVGNYRVAGGIIMTNILVINRNALNLAGFYGGYYAHNTYVNCNAVCPSDKPSTGIAFRNHNTTNEKLVNCAGFGFTTFADGSPTGSNNASDTTISFGTSNQASLTYANQFVGTTDATRDYVLKGGNSLADNGTADTTDMPAANDIVGTSRPQGSAWDIGVYETVVASTVVSNPLSLLGAGP